MEKHKNKYHTTPAYGAFKDYGYRPCMLLFIAEGMIKLYKPYDRHHDGSNMKTQDLASLQDELFKPNLDTTIPKGRGLNNYENFLLDKIPVQFSAHFYTKVFL
jgi:hypothetical protein